MSIWNKVLIGLIIVASLGLFYVSLRALQTHRYWRTAANKHEAKLAQLPKEIERLKYGEAEGEECVQSLRIALYKELIDRGRVWYNCAPQQVAAATGEVRVKISKPSPHGIIPNMVLLVFEEKGPKAQGRYLGEFKVKEVGDNLVGMEPSMAMIATELQLLAQSKGPWTLCELTPKDSHDVFAGLSPDELKAILPANTVQEYLDDGKDGKKRQLRDYRVLLKSFDRQRAVLIEKVETAKRHKDYVEAALADAKRQVQFRQDELASLRTELAEMTRQHDATLAHQKGLEKELADRKARIALLIAESRAVADEIAQAQAEAVRRVDQRNAVAKQ